MNTNRILIAATIGLIAGCHSDSSRQTAIPPDAKIEEVKGKEPNANMHVAAADLALMQGNRDEAVKQYERALLINPNQTAALFKLATLRVYAHDFDAAVGLWQRYIVATNDSAEGYSNLGRTHELAGHWKDGEVAYLKAIQRDPMNKSARVNYGILLAKRDRFDEAETQLSAVLAPAEVQYNLGSVFELRKNYPAARIAYEKAIDLDGTLVAAKQRLDLLKGVTVAE